MQVYGLSLLSSFHEIRLSPSGRKVLLHMKKPSVALYLLVAALLCLVMGVNARADQIIASSTGLTTPTQTLTFDEIVLPMNASLTNQYAGLGVSFSPNAFYSPQTNFGNVQGNDIGNFTFSGGGPISPITIIFSSALNGAAFSFEADTTPYLFSDRDPRTRHHAPPRRWRPRPRRCQAHEKVTSAQAKIRPRALTCRGRFLSIQPPASILLIANVQRHSANEIPHASASAAAHSSGKNPFAIKLEVIS